MLKLFETKKQKLERERLENEARYNKEIETRAKIHRTLNSLKRQSKKFDDFKADYIEKARKAALVGNQQTYNLAKQGLRTSLAKQRYLDAMVTNFEIALQNKEMDKVVTDFVEGINLIAQDMQTITSSVDINKAQQAYQRALLNNQTQFEALDAFLKETEETIDQVTIDDGSISDEEIDRLIDNQAANSESEIDSEIEDKIAAIRQKMNG